MDKDEGISAEFFARIKDVEMKVYAIRDVMRACNLGLKEAKEAYQNVCAKLVIDEKHITPEQLETVIMAIKKGKG